MKKEQVQKRVNDMISHAKLMETHMENLYAEIWGLENDLKESQANQFNYDDLCQGVLAQIENKVYGLSYNIMDDNVRLEHDSYSDRMEISIDVSHDSIDEAIMEAVKEAIEGYFEDLKGDDEDE
jgi:hypothetical protein